MLASNPILPFVGMRIVLRSFSHASLSRLSGQGLSLCLTLLSFDFSPSFGGGSRNIAKSSAKIIRCRPSIQAHSSALDMTFRIAGMQPALQASEN